MDNAKFTNLKSFIYPIKKYPSTCFSFTCIVLLISLTAFFIGISDDRGFSLKNYLIDSYIVGDFSQYEGYSLSNVFINFSDFFSGRESSTLATENRFAIGPIIPLLIWVSKSLTNNFFPFYLFSIYLSYWFIALSIDLSINFLPWFESEFSEKIFSLTIFNKIKIELSNVEMIGIIFNPIIIYYVIFPATDLIFACLTLAIVINFTKKEFLNCYLMYICSLLVRPTGLFLFPCIIFIFYYEIKKRSKSRILIHIFLTVFTLVIFSYYSEYAYANFEGTLNFGNHQEGLSVWGLPIPKWIIFHKGNFTFFINKIAAVVFTPFIQLISILGVRPSFMTTYDGDLSNAISIASTKPFFYAFIRMIWGAIITLPGLLVLLLNYLKFKKVDLFIFLIIVFSFAIGLSSSIPLERYLFFAFPLLSLSSISFYYRFIKIKEF